MKKSFTFDHKEIDPLLDEKDSTTDITQFKQNYEVADQSRTIPERQRVVQFPQPAYQRTWKSFFNVLCESWCPVIAVVALIILVFWLLASYHRESDRS
jgi:hypothetical protein